MNFAENFKNARLAVGLTQQQVADALGLDRSAIAHYEMGDSMPNARNLLKICELLNTTLKELLTEQCSFGSNDFSMKLRKTEIKAEFFFRKKIMLLLTTSVL